MKIVTVVGARPQFVKAGTVSRALRKEHKEVLVHTGQHYDKSMSQAIFEDLDIPKPDYNLSIGSGSHGKQTGRMLEKIEEVLFKEQPDLMLVYGDTNSTIAGALAASKLHIPVAHVEAGLRSYNMQMPEEQNRILTDHLSSLLLCPTDTAIRNLQKEGMKKGVYNVGDVMFDAALYNISIARTKSKIMNQLQLHEQSFVLATVHRAENTNDLDKLESIFKAFLDIDEKIILPLHPRTENIIKENHTRFDFIKNTSITMIEPISYLDMIMLEENAKFIMTDSGGIQKEAFFFKIPCITLREETEWIETLTDEWNVLVGADMDKILKAAVKVSGTNYDQISQRGHYGEGNASQKIIEVIEKELLW